MSLPPRRHIAIVAVTVAMSAAVGCGSRGGDDTGASVHDSSGIRIVTSGATGQWAEGAAWRLVQDQRIGELEGPPEYTFNQIAAVAVAPGDTVFVLDAGDKIIKAYDPDGHFVRQFGREGEGPGEFNDPRDLIATPDGLLAYDWRQHRLTLFANDGKVIRTMPVHPSIMFGSHLRVLDDSTIALGVSTGYSIPRRPETEGKFWLLRLDFSGKILDTLIRAQGGDATPHWDNQSLFVLPAPFPRGPQFDAAPNGRVAFGRGETYAIDVYRADPDWRLASSIRRTAPPLRATEDDRAAYRSQFTNPRMPAQLRSVYADLVGQVTYPETWPAYEALLFDAANRLWVEEPAHSADSLVPWSVFAPDESYLGTVMIPKRLRQVRVIGDDAIWGVEQDELGVQSVVRYRIDR
jgi:hypothetical protein